MKKFFIKNRINILVVVVLFFMLINCGCVRRLVTIDSQPQGAQVYFDRRTIGETPCTYEFTYYGDHYLELAKDGHANFNTVIKLRGPFYEYFPFSFFSELLIPWELTDEHNFSFNLQPGETRKPVITPIEQPQISLPAPKLERIKEKE